MIIAIAGIATASFAAIKYSQKSNLKREENLLRYFETKNGHMERIANSFSATNDKMAEALTGLTVQIAVLNSKHNRKPRAKKTK